MDKVYLVVRTAERWRSYNKVECTVEICATKEVAVKVTNRFIKDTKRTAYTLSGAEYGFEYSDRLLTEEDLFSCPCHIGDVVYYDSVVFSRTRFEDNHRKGQWSVHIEEWPIRE